MRENPNRENLTHRGEGRWRSEDPDASLSELSSDVVTGGGDAMKISFEASKKCPTCGYYHLLSHDCPELGLK